MVMILIKIEYQFLTTKILLSEKQTFSYSKAFDKWWVILCERDNYMYRNINGQRFFCEKKKQNKKKIIKRF